MHAWKQSGYLSVFHYGVNAEQRLSYRMMEDAPKHPSFPHVPQPCLIFHGYRIRPPLNFNAATRTPMCNCLIPVIRGGKVVWDSEGLAAADAQLTGPYSNFK